jgi:hypothetical protein
MLKLLAFSLLSAISVSASTQFQVGTARICITPREPVRLAGYAARTHSSTGVAGDIWAKALAIQDSHGGKVVIITMDLLRVPVTDLAGEMKRRYGLARSQFLLNCSHNHSAPSLWEGDPFSALSSEDRERSKRYTESLTANLIELAGSALRNLAPASIRFGTSEASFGANRRFRTPKGYDIRYNPDGPTDHRVPVLEVIGGDGKLRAVLFGYTCHNTTLAADSYDVAGDYAGFAQEEIERTHPGATALFLQLCAGDQDPHPRGTLALAKDHGKELASAVEKALDGKLKNLRGPVRTAFETVDLALAPHTRETFEKRLSDPNPAAVRTARAMLKDYDDGHPLRALSYPIQAVRIGPKLALVAIGGEPVVDYALRAQRELPNVILAGYSNRVKGYIPSKRVLAEGGYEGGESAIYYGLPGPFTPDVEDSIFGGIKAVLRQTEW